MPPKTLNVEKLNKKFASLTRSRESIQGLSFWIMHHKEFCNDIVGQWFEALSEDFNALSLFYVANDVIQHCGKRKAPEYREAFSSILEKSVSLEKVKEIKSEVIRMFSLWQDRGIYDEEFIKSLEDKLNSEHSDCKRELKEDEVIKNYKLENLTRSLKKLQAMEKELLKKESFLDDIDEPSHFDLDNLIVKMEKDKELKKLNNYKKIVDEYLVFSESVQIARKNALKELKYASIFYDAQLEDAKKVSHAYSIYEKKVKLLQKSLIQKVDFLPEMPLPTIEESCVEDTEPEEIKISPDSCSETDKTNDLEGTVNTPKNVSNISLEEEVNISTDLSSKLDISDNMSEDNTKQKNLDRQHYQNEVDVLLEEAYESHHRRDKLAFKRKLENLLKLNKSKVSKADNEDCTSNNIKNSVPVSIENKENFQDRSLMENSANSHSLPPISDNLKECVSIVEENTEMSVSQNSSIPEKATVETKTLVLESVSLCPETMSNAPDNILKSSSETSQCLNLDTIKDASHSMNTSISPQKTAPNSPQQSDSVQIQSDYEMSSSVECNSFSNENSSVDISLPKNISGQEMETEVKSSTTITVCSGITSSSTLHCDSSTLSDTVFSKITLPCVLSSDTLPNTMYSDGILQNLSGNDNFSSKQVKCSDFLESLRNVLHTFANSACKDDKNNGYLDPFAEMPLENSLKVYNYLLQNCKPANSLKCYSSQSLNTESNVVLQTNICSQDKQVLDLAPLKECTRTITADYSREDNLEVMDMEIDSDSEN